MDDNQYHTRIEYNVGATLASGERLQVLDIFGLTISNAEMIMSTGIIRLLDFFDDFGPAISFKGGGMV